MSGTQKVATEDCPLCGQLISGSLSGRLECGDLEVNGLRVKRAGKEIKLTRREYWLLIFLMQNKGRVVTQQMVEEHSYLWGKKYDGLTNCTAVYINYLRNKIDKGQPKKLIHTVRGFGYTMEEREREF